MQWDKDSSSYKPVVISGIGGMLKQASLSGQFDGMEVTFEECDGGLVSATCTIYRKDCTHSFKNTAHYTEYATTNRDGKITYMWQAKGHIMLGKCAKAAALRDAFPAELGGVYVSEEFQQADPPAPDFRVESLPEPDTKVSTAKVPRGSTPESTSDVRRELERPAEPEPSAKDRFKAESLRILTDIAIPVKDRKAVLNGYLDGFLGADAKTPESSFDALHTLEHFAMLHDEGLKEDLLHDPGLVGRENRAYIQNLFDQYEWPLGMLLRIDTVMRKFGLEEKGDLERYLNANNIGMDDFTGVSMFLRLALYDRDIATFAADLEHDVEHTVAVLEQHLGGQLERFDTKTVKQCLEDIKTKGATA